MIVNKISTMKVKPSLIHWINRKVFSRHQHTRADKLWSKVGGRIHLSRTWQCKGCPCGNGFEGMKGSRRTSEAWHLGTELESLKGGGGLTSHW